MKEYIVRYETEQIENSEFFYGGKVECELIRCKDCRWFLPNESKRRGWCSFSQRGYPKADDYCSDAERKPG